MNIARNLIISSVLASFFRDNASQEKSNFIKKIKLCFGCLRKDHFSRNCKNKATCSICHRNHSTVLHDPSKIIVSRADNREENDASSNHCESAESRNCFVKTGIKTKIISPILPAKVRVKGCNSEIIINCALDTCSSDCWINEKL